MPEQASLNFIANHYDSFAALPGAAAIWAPARAQVDIWEAQRQALVQTYIEQDGADAYVISGYQYLGYALTGRFPLVVAIAEGVVRAALSYTSEQDGRLSPCHVGSTHESAGAGTYLQAHLAGLAAAIGVGVVGIYAAAAHDYHVRIGRIVDRAYLGSSEWDLLDCQQIA